MVSLLGELKTEETDFVFLSPMFIISLIVSYLLFVYQIGPRLMKNRPPFKLKYVMSIYNIIQVASCFYLINGIWALGSWDILKFRQCVYYLPNTRGREKFNNLTLFTLWLKIFELCDTIIFVLRKKQNQITYLHVFHHSSTITLVYVLVKYFKGLGALYPIYLNSWVHVIMYTYYFFANICSAEVMKKFIYIKKSITIIQMIQFCMILTQAMFMWTHCQIPFILLVYYYLIVCVIFYGFYDFYKKTYLNNQINNKLKNES